MTDDELRALVRDAIARHLGGRMQPDVDATHGALNNSAHGATTVPLWRSHPSFGKFLVPGGAEQGGPCIIEPSVSCNHCGFCQSYGH